MTEVYLDHAATTKLSKEALGAMLPYLLNEYGNPSSQYSIGERARKAVTKAREQIAAALVVQSGGNLFYFWWNRSR